MLGSIDRPDESIEFALITWSIWRNLRGGSFRSRPNTLKTRGFRLDRRARIRPARVDRGAFAFAVAASFGLGLAGCGHIAKHPFRAWNDPSSINRARSTHVAERLPINQAIPSLINRLDDKDEVVRLTANHELKRLSGKDFGFQPWGSAKDRAAASERWKAWWRSYQAGLAKTEQLP